MNKLFRTLMILASCALTSALFAGSYNIDLGAYTDPGYVTSDQGFLISITGSGDNVHSGFTVINTDTNQVVLTVGFMHVTALDGWLHYTDSIAPGVSVTVLGTDTYFTGLPDGNYTVQLWTDVPDLQSVDAGGYMELPTVNFNSENPNYWVKFSGYQL